MPIASLFCPGCRQDNLPLNHWQQACSTLAADTRASYHAMLSSQLADKRHAAGHVTITRLLSCPREWILPDFLPVSFDPRNSATTHIGTIRQRDVAAHAPEGWVAEREVKGILFGLPTSASIDLSKREGDRGYISEGKFHRFSKDGGQPWKLKPEMRAQVSMQKLLWEQQEPGLTVVAGDVCRNWMGPEQATFQVEFMSEEEIGRLRPNGSDYTVAQIAGLAGRCLAAIQGQVTGSYEKYRELVQDLLPLVGENMFGGKKCSSYCSVSKLCGEIASAHEALKAGGRKW